MQCEACQRWSGHVSKADCINRTSEAARCEHLQESWRHSLTAKKEGARAWVGGGLAQSEINNATLIHHKPVITAGPPVAKTFHSKQLQRVGGRLLRSMFMKCLGISIFRLALHSISISFWSPFKFISSILWELIQWGNSPAMVLHRCPQIRMTGLEWAAVLWSTGDGAYHLNPQQLLLAKALINFFTYPTDDERHLHTYPS